MDGFIKIPGILKNLLIEFFAVFLFSATVTGLANTIKPGILGDGRGFESELDWVFGAVGPLLFIWLLFDIFQPRVKIESWLRIGTFKFCGTHPSYVLYDALIVAIALFFLWLAQSSGSSTCAFWLMLGTALSIPFSRLFAWYVLKLKINDPEVFDAHKPALWVFIIFSLIFGGVAFAGFIP